MSMIRPLVAHLDPADHVLGQLISEPVSQDWTTLSRRGHARIDDYGFAKLVCHLAGYKDDDRIAVADPVSFQNVSATFKDEERKNLRLYGYVGTLLASQLSGIPKGTSDTLLIAIDLLGFTPAASDMDFIASAAHAYVQDCSAANQSNSYVLFMVHSSREVVCADPDDMPEQLKTFVNDEKRRINILVFDYERRLCYKLDKVASERDLFRLPVRDEDIYNALDFNAVDFEESISFGANMHIGHYALANAHVRTHYDIREFLRNDYAREATIHELTKLFADMRSRKIRCIIVVGIHELSLLNFANMFAATSSAVEVIPASELGNERNRKAVRNCDRIVLLTDIVNTGKTLQSCANEVRAIASGRSVNIRMLAIAKMRNTAMPNGLFDLRVLATIHRDYYPPEECVLCTIKQVDPNNKVTVTSPKMFMHATQQMTPYDFWEMAWDRRALILHESPSGHERALWISADESTRNLTGMAWRYRRWFCAFLRERLQNAGISPGSITSIATVKESSDCAFAVLVASVLGLSESIIEIPREALEKDEKAKGGLLNGNHLLVCDGIHTGGTMRALARYCTKGHVEAAVSLYSMLDERHMSYLADDCFIQHEKLVYLYGWRRGDEAAENQLAAMIRHWGEVGYDYDPIGIIADYCLRRQDKTDLIDVFHMNSRLYDNVFCNDAYLTESGRREFVKRLSNDSNLNHYVSDAVKDEYEVLARVAESLLRESSTKKEEAAGEQAEHLADDHSNPSQCSSCNAMTLERQELFIDNRTVPMYVNRESKEIIGTGFLFEYAGGSNKTFVITADHVAKKACAVPGNEYANTLSFGFNAYKYNANIVYRKDECSMIDITVLECENKDISLPVFSNFGTDVEPSSSQCMTFSYQASNKRQGYPYPLSFNSNNRGQSGECEYLVLRTGSGSSVPALTLGCSGSPVVDEFGNLLGVIVSLDNHDGGRQTVGVVKASKIQELIEELLKEEQ